MKKIEMKKKTILTITVLSASLAFAAACSGGADTSTPKNTDATANKTATANANTANSAHNNAAKGNEETPATVKAAFPDASSFTKQHKDIPKDAVAKIETDAGGKIADTDHHSYLAFSSAGGARRQIGAATLVNAGGKDFVVVYENKDGSPVIKEVRGEGVSNDFLKQFAGKGHDDKFAFGTTIKAGGADENLAKALTTAIAVDVMTMQTLYGAAHTH